MIIENIPGYGHLSIDHLILDLNGTLAIDGELIDGLSDRLIMLREKVKNIYLFTGDTHGNGKKISDKLGLKLKLTKTAEEKLYEASIIGLESTLAIGNGLIDSQLLKAVKIGIVVLQSEGAHVQTLLSADVVVPSIHDALDLLIWPQRLIATLRS